ncbi:MAG TPA: aminotransferase class III-fold pyridoxal phosphate-dependent enzyme, partial [Candidatus Hydrogenedentes bacterium]|nr:aminotransferase class III-fold pyridoxal phosphate-dependent enzyme [Candidatus Hydrogenedentota bacterium]
QNSFHGRTLATLTATGQTKYQAGFEPLMPGVRYVPYGDAEALESAITPDTGLVLLEPVQGEGGVRVPPTGYLAAVREICDRRGVLLAFDEVQTGMGRTGHLFAHQHEQIAPDIISLAKALGNGIPIGAVGCAERVADGFAPGTHATTFGGNPLATAAGVAVMETLTAPGFLENVRDKGVLFMDLLRQLAIRHESIVEIRGKGLMVGVEFRNPVAPVVAAMTDNGVLCGAAGPNVLRFLPPLVAEPDHFAHAAATLDRALEEMGW